MDDNFFGSLFDLSFDTYVTPRIISILYVIAMIFIGLGTLSYAFSGFARGTVIGIITLITSPIAFLLGVIATRVYCEVIIAMIKIAQNTQSLKNK